jgi:outer membrane protein OmpU
MGLLELARAKGLFRACPLVKQEYIVQKSILWAAAAGLSLSPAVAEPFSFSVGGYFNSVLYSVDADTGYDDGSKASAAKAFKDISFQEDAEIIFKAKGKTNNGLTVGMQIQLEGATESDQIDEHYIYVSGDFGKLEVGAENSGADKLQIQAPRFAGWKTYDNNFGTWSSVAKYEKPKHDNYSADANKLTYYSPNISGLQAAVSITPSSENKNGAGTDALLAELEGAKTHEDITSLGVRYTGKFGGVRVKASVTTEQGDYIKDGENKGEMEETAYGVSLSSGRFTLGGTHFISDEASAGGNDWEITHLGLAYKWSKATTLGFAVHTQKDTQTNSDADMDTDVTIIGGSTKLGSGVKLTYTHESVESSGALAKDASFTGVGLLLKF